jgi:DNA-3-methyladenine glycosylase I
MAADGLIVGEDGVTRCAWGSADPDYRAYHDTEWGFPVSDDVRLFEKLSLEGFQAGLSWLTILRKREAFREAFAGFDFARVARFGERDVRRLLDDAGIVRHRGKIEAVINNAARALELVEAEGSLAGYVWRIEPPPRTGKRDLAGLAQLASTAESKALAKISGGAAGDSSGRRRCTRSCRRWGLSTTISTAARRTTGSIARANGSCGRERRPARGACRKPAFQSQTRDALGRTALKPPGASDGGVRGPVNGPQLSRHKGSPPLLCGRFGSS